jgi:hypothetical protein
VEQFEIVRHYHGSALAGVDTQIRLSNVGMIKVVRDVGLRGTILVRRAVAAPAESEWLCVLTLSRSERAIQLA